MGTFSDRYKEEIGQRSFSERYKRETVLTLPKEVKEQSNIAIDGELPFQAHALASASDKPEHIIRSLAQYRFPTLSVNDASKRYFMKDNEVYYLDNDGVERKENRETGLKKAIEEIDPTKLDPKIFAARGLLEVPPAVVAAGTQLTTGQPVAAAVTAGLTRAVQTKIAQMLAEREPDYGEVLVTGTTEALGSVIGDFIARRGLAAFDDILKKATGGKQMKELVGEDIQKLQSPETIASAENIMRIARENGISLDMAQLLQTSRAAATQKAILQEGGAGAEILKEQSAKTADQAFNALKRLIRNISPDMGSRFSVGKELVETAQLARKALKDARGELSNIAYNEAFKRQSPVDTLPVIKQIDDIMDTKVARGGATYNTLNKIRNTLLKNSPENHPAVVEIDMLISEMPQATKAASELMDARNRITNNPQMVEDRLEKLDSAKIEIDKILKYDKSAAVQDKIPGKERFHIEAIRGALLDQMDASNPAYKAARQAYQEASTPVKAFDKTILDAITKLEGDNVIKAPKRLIAADFSDPSTIRQAKRFIQKHNPRAWNSAVRVFMEQELDKIGETLSGRGIAEGFRTRVWKPQMRDRMKAALEPNQFRALNDYMMLVKNLGISIDANSDTAMKQIRREALKQQAGGKTAAALRTMGRYTDMLKLNFRDVADTIEEVRSPEYMKELARAITAKDKDILDGIKRMKYVNPKTKRFIELMGTFTGTITSRMGYQKSQVDEYSSKEDVIKYLSGMEE